MSRRWVPGVPDLVFGLVLLSTLIGGRYRLLNDPGTNWHLRLGRDILKDGAVPRVDMLSFTRAGQPWVDQSWPGAEYDTGTGLPMNIASVKLNGKAR